MSKTIKRAVASASASLVLAGGLAAGLMTAATAGDPEGSEPCAKEQAQVDRAEAKLADLQAVFDKARKDLRKAEKALEKAESKKEKKKAEEAVEEAEDDVEKAKKDKKAQVKRLEKAQERLEECQAGTPTEEPTEEPTETSAPVAG